MWPNQIRSQSTASDRKSFSPQGIVGVFGKEIALIGAVVADDLLKAPNIAAVERAKTADLK